MKVNYVQIEQKVIAMLYKYCIKAMANRSPTTKKKCICFNKRCINTFVCMKNINTFIYMD